MYSESNTILVPAVGGNETVSIPRGDFPITHQAQLALGGQAHGAIGDK